MNKKKQQRHGLIYFKHNNFDYQENMPLHRKTNGETKERIKHIDVLYRFRLKIC